MKKIKYNLPDVNFCITTSDEYYDLVAGKLNESIIPFKNNVDRTIDIEYIVNQSYFVELRNKIKTTKGTIYDSFKNQTHKEIVICNKRYYLVDSEEYICVKDNDLSYQIIVQENNNISANWIARIIRELYLREKEDLGFSFMHGTGLEINNKGLLLLGASGSGKTTLAVKFLETNKKKKFLSNDRVLISKDGYMDYFPHAVTYAMGTVKNNKHLEDYFKKTKVIEKNKKINYEDTKDTDDCNTPLTDVEKVYKDTVMTARNALDTIIYPRFHKDMEDFEIIEMTKEEKIELLLQTDFTPIDSESLRKVWIRERHIKEDDLLNIKDYLINQIIDNVNIKKVKYGVKTNVEDILNNL